MEYFDIDFAIKLHDDIIDEIGGLKGFNKTQIGYLISALEQIKMMIFILRYAIK